MTPATITSTWSTSESRAASALEAEDWERIAVPDLSRSVLCQEVLPLDQEDVLAVLRGR
jgi:hypothetical protein